MQMLQTKTKKISENNRIKFPESTIWEPKKKELSKIEECLKIRDINHTSERRIRKTRAMRNDGQELAYFETNGKELTVNLVSDKRSYHIETNLYDTNEEMYLEVNRFYTISEVVKYLEDFNITCKMQ